MSMCIVASCDKALDFTNIASPDGANAWGCDLYGADMDWTLVYADGASPDGVSALLSVAYL